MFLSSSLQEIPAFLQQSTASCLFLKILYFYLNSPISFFCSFSFHLLPIQLNIHCETLSFSFFQLHWLAILLTSIVNLFLAKFLLAFIDLRSGSYQSCFWEIKRFSVILSVMKIRVLGSGYQFSFLWSIVWSWLGHSSTIPWILLCLSDQYHFYSYISISSKNNSTSQSATAIQ